MMGVTLQRNRNHLRVRLNGEICEEMNECKYQGLKKEVEVSHKFSGVLGRPNSVNTVLRHGC